jgi:threonine dehydrogenase-like Zn-dependent dehydrogenase
MHPALVVSPPGPMSIEYIPTKRPQTGEILVAPVCASICGSDLDLLRGTRPIGTRILGHEGIAEIVEVGPGPTPFAVGQRVTFLPNNPTNVEDILGVSTEGLFQRFLLISQSALERGMVIPCDPALPLVCGPLLEPFATVLYGQRLVEQVCRPKSMMVVGAGAIGLLNILSAKARGCSQILLVDTSRARLDWAVRRGIVDPSCAFLNSPKLAEILLEHTEGRGVDVAYICTPRTATRSVLEQTLHIVRAEGCINLTAGTDSREPLSSLPEVDLTQVRQANVCGLGYQVTHCVTGEGKPVFLTGHSGASALDVQEAMDLLLADSPTYARVISHVVSYRTVPRVVEELLAPQSRQRSEAPYVKVIIDLTIENLMISEFNPPRL